MAQLKSFRYFEPEAAHEVAIQVESPVHQDANLPEGSDSGSSSWATGGAGRGGALTSTSSGHSNGANREQVRSPGESTLTLGSSEELQMIHHDMIEEEEDTQGATGGANAAGKPAPVANAIRSQLTKSPALRLGSQTPMIVRRQGPGSPELVKGANKQSGDNLSQLSFGQRPNGLANHYEIRWQNITLLRSGQSRLPKFIADSAIYKAFAGTAKADSQQGHSGQSGQAKFCYSPPVMNKFATTSTISTGEKTNSADCEPPDAFVRPDTILDNVSGSVFSGQMTAILGPSGVGKTSLLNSLTGRNTLDGSGRVSVIGNAQAKRMSVVTVPQADVLPSKLTTLEDLRFTSRLKNPQRNFKHEHNIERVVKHLQMDKFLHTQIDRLSGGEARRLSIGRELLSSPDIMILDEPTSGLDANTCKKIIAALRDIVEHSDYILDKPMSIIVTIHQPQQEVLNLFHRVYVMALGGRAIYEGPPASMLASLLANSSLGRLVPVDQLNENPAIVALELASGEYGPALINELTVHHECQVYEDAPMGSPSPFSTPKIAPRSPLSVSPRFGLAARRERIDSIDGSIGSLGRPTPLVGRRQAANRKLADQMSSMTSLSYASTYDAELPEPQSKLKVDKRLRRSVVMRGDFLSQTWTLIQRCWLLTTRDRFLMAIRILGFILVGAGMVQIFRHALDPDEHQCPVYESEVDDIMGFIQATRQRLFNIDHTLRQQSSTHLFFFHLVLCIMMVTSALTGLVFPLQMRMFVREYKNGWYSPASFITSTTLAELPIDMIGPTISILIVYPLCNQPAADHLWRELGYILVVVISAVVCKAQAQIVGALLMDSVENSVFCSCVMVAVPALMSGIAVRISSMPYFIQILSYGSFIRYTFESLMCLRYGYGICPCDPDIINGYPSVPSVNAIPARLDTLARGLLDLGQPDGANSSLIGDSIVAPYEQVDKYDGNLFVRFLRLISDASNLFVTNRDELGDCSRYRSLYLVDREIEDYILPKWMGVLFFMFILSRLLTYSVVKAVIKMRKN